MFSWQNRCSSKAMVKSDYHMPLAHKKTIKTTHLDILMVQEDERTRKFCGRKREKTNDVFQ
jgi:uncharacterized protein YciI